MHGLSQLDEDVDLCKSNKRIVLDSNHRGYGKDFCLKSACNLYTSHHASNTFNNNNILWIMNYDIYVTVQLLQASNQLYPFQAVM